MKLWISGEVQSEVADAYRLARRAVEEQINSLLKNRALGASVEKWALVGILRAEADGLYPELHCYSKPSKVAEFRLRLDYGAFRGADHQAQKKMVIDALERSIELSKDLDMDDFDRNVWRSIIESA